MNRLKTTILLGGLTGLVIFGVVGYAVLTQKNIPSAPVPDISSPALPTPGPMTIIGEITCLSKKGVGPQSAECAIGLKGLDGRHYGLKNLFQHDPEYKFSVGGLRVEVSGTFSPEKIKGPDSNEYDVAGVIDITSIKEVKQVSGGDCKITGCSGQVCSDQDVITTCEFRPEYACYANAICERQENGQCGWTPTSELGRCLQSVKQ